MNDILATIITHVVSATLGGVVVYVAMMRHVSVVQVHGHPAFEVHSSDETEGEPARGSRRVLKWSGWLPTFMGLLLIGLGSQMWVSVDSARHRDRVDRAYADCLAALFNDFVESAEARLDASDAVDDAKSDRSKAIDQAVKVIVETRENPPRATADELDEAFEDVLRARVRLDQVRKQQIAVRAANQFQLPEVVCER